MNRHAVSKSGLFIFPVALILLLSCGGGGKEGTESPPVRKWAWISGSSAVDDPGEALGYRIPDPDNLPGARVAPSGWFASNGTLWFFGGLGPVSGRYNELWNFDGSLWTWVHGSQGTGNHPGYYGTLREPSSLTVPGARNRIMAWINRDEDLILFGGYGYANSGTDRGYLNDLWGFDVSTYEWTWSGGDDVVNAAGEYGTLGVSAADNWPGARESAVTWQDGSGGIWLFGGYGYADSTALRGRLSDLWYFDGALWTWLSGPRDAVNQGGVYGTQGVDSVDNLPGSRQGAVGWIGSEGNLMLFGGDGHDSTGTRGLLNDLWMYDLGISRWIWMGGSDTVGAPGSYGSVGSTTTINWPGGRESAQGVTDTTGRLWLFGGEGYDSSGSLGFLNDMWLYEDAQWTWITGNDEISSPGNYGVMGSMASSHVPGSRYGVAMVPDLEGDIWIFGGYGIDGNSVEGGLNDLWRFRP